MENCQAISVLIWTNCRTTSHNILPSASYQPTVEAYELQFSRFSVWILMKQIKTIKFGLCVTTWFKCYCRTVLVRKYPFVQVACWTCIWVRNQIWELLAGAWGQTSLIPYDFDAIGTIRKGQSSYSGERARTVTLYVHFLTCSALWVFHVGIRSCTSRGGSCSLRLDFKQFMGPSWPRSAQNTRSRVAVQPIELFWNSVIDGYGMERWRSPAPRPHCTSTNAGRLQLLDERCVLSPCARYSRDLTHPLCVLASSHSAHSQNPVTRFPFVAQNRRRIDVPWKSWRS
jgi:hypothetical protein